MINLYLEAFSYFGTLIGIFMIFRGIEILFDGKKKYAESECPHDAVQSIKEYDQSAKKDIYKNVCKKCGKEWEFTPIHLRRKKTKNKKTKN